MAQTVEVYADEEGWRHQRLDDVGKRKGQPSKPVETFQEAFAIAASEHPDATVVDRSGGTYAPVPQTGKK